MEPVVIALLCLVLALMLLAGEVFLPTGGMLGLLAAFSLIVSIYMAKVAFYDTRPALWYTFLLVVLVVVPGSAIAMYRSLLTSEYGRQIVLHPPPPEASVGFDEEGHTHLLELVGQFGQAVSDLQPSGIARIDGERLDVVSEGTVIEAGEPIKVIKLRGVYPVVRAADPDELDAFRAAAEANDASAPRIADVSSDAAAASVSPDLAPSDPIADPADDRTPADGERHATASSDATPQTFGDDHADRPPDIVAQDDVPHDDLTHDDLTHDDDAESRSLDPFDPFVDDDRSA